MNSRSPEPPADAGPQRLCFIHVPKCGGQSLSSVIRQAYSPNQVCPATFLREFQTLSESEATRYHLYLGHMGFAQARRIGGKTVTVLRDPVDRVLSLFSYWKALGADAGPGPALVQSMTLADFLESKEPAIVTDLVNAQTWQLAFDHSLEARHQHRGLGAEEVLAQAKKNLTAVDVVGICEDMEGTQFLLTSVLGLGSGMPIPVVNKTKQRMARSDLAPSLEERIRQVVGLDLQLYEQARSFFEAHLAQQRRIRLAG